MPRSVVAHVSVACGMSLVEFAVNCGFRAALFGLDVLAFALLIKSQLLFNSLQVSRSNLGPQSRAPPGGQHQEIFLWNSYSFDAFLRKEQ